MKIILSRKGFDSNSGVLCNPILPDGTLLSLPIPEKNGVKYTDLEHNIENGSETITKSYEEIINDLNNNKAWTIEDTCHLDPDLKAELHKQNDNWRPAFGQSGKACTFLDNNKIKEDDIFLFFGRFKQTEIDNNGILRYMRGAKEQHIIYAYMQIGEIIDGVKIQKDFLWHPHAKYGNSLKNNHLYIPSEKLSLNSNVPGFGLMEYNQHRVLTRYESDVSLWNLPDFFRGLHISVETCNTPLLNRFNDSTDGQSYFRYPSYGQEFILNPYVGDEYSEYYENALQEWTYLVITGGMRDPVSMELKIKKYNVDFGKYNNIRIIQDDVIVYNDATQTILPKYKDELSYCRYYHKILDFNNERCRSCPLYFGDAQDLGVDCSYKLPDFIDDNINYGSYTPRSKYAFIDIMIEKGILPRYV